MGKLKKSNNCFFSSCAWRRVNLSDGKSSTSVAVKLVSRHFWPLVFNQSKLIETEIEKVLLLTLCNLLMIQKEEEKE